MTSGLKIAHRFLRAYDATRVPDTMRKMTSEMYLIANHAAPSMALNPMPPRNSIESADSILPRESKRNHFLLYNGVRPVF